MPDISEVADFYSGKTFFITGGTGFLGVSLIEKILRSLPDVSRIYLMLRPKKGKPIQDRLQEITSNTIFEKLLETESPDIFSKLVAVAGEMDVPDLGLSEEDRGRLCREVNVVVHSAATLDFQQNLRPTVSINLLGTRAVMDLCKQMTQLKVVVHVSSAYVNSFRLSCEEILYAAPENVEKVIGLSTTLTDAALEVMEPKLLGNHPNTYTFTKHFAEHEVAKVSHLFPCTIVRPSMITGAWKEPIPGWTNSKNGPQGFLMGASRGVVRRLPIVLSNITDYIPVDVVVNELLVAGFRSGSDGGPLAIYHCTSSTVRPFTWASIEHKMNKYLRKYPLKGAVWYPNVKFVSSIWRFRLSAIFVHFIPAYILDFVTRISGGRPILVRLHTNVNASVQRLRRFVFEEWKFYNTKTMELSRTLNETDKKKFYIDITSLQWDSYFDDLTLGVRRYLTKEPDKTLPAARGKQTMLMIFHLMLKLFLLVGAWFIVSRLMGTSMRQCAWFIPIGYFVSTLI